MKLEANALHQENGDSTKIVSLEYFSIRDLHLESSMIYSELTFIIMAPAANTTSGATNQHEEAADQLTMVGDINLFLKGTPPHLRCHETRVVMPNEEEEDAEDNFEAELEIMIAGSWSLGPLHTVFNLGCIIEPTYRRQGIALEAIQLMISFATSSPSMSIFSDRTRTYPKQLPIPHSSLVARISESNIPSIKLFERVGFRVVKRVEVFKEVEMRWRQ